MSDSINELNADLFGEARAREQDPKAARKKAMDYLARREYGYAELVGRLVAAGFSEELADEVVAALAADGLQNDERFASSFVSARVGRGSGPLRIVSALKERGLDAALAARAVDEEDVDWFELAREARRKKFGLEPIEAYPEKARQMRFLQYRGFDFEHIRYAVDER